MKCCFIKLPYSCFPERPLELRRRVCVWGGSEIESFGRKHLVQAGSNSQGFRVSITHLGAQRGSWWQFSPVFGRWPQGRLTRLESLASYKFLLYLQGPVVSSPQVLCDLSSKIRILNVIPHFILSSVFLFFLKWRDWDTYPFTLCRFLGLGGCNVETVLGRCDDRIREAMKKWTAWTGRKGGQGLKIWGRVSVLTSFHLSLLPSLHKASSLPHHMLPPWCTALPQAQKQWSQLAIE
jgi:hypothetical protein